MSRPAWFANVLMPFLGVSGNFHQDTRINQLSKDVDNFKDATLAKL